jgi:tetratricopeptide (TPR) repeat protein
MVCAPVAPSANAQHEAGLAHAAVHSYKLAFDTPEFVRDDPKAAAAAYFNQGLNSVTNSKAHAQAINYFRQSIELDNTTNAHVALGNCYVDIQNLDLAEEAYLAAIELDDACADAHLELGSTLLAKHELQEKAQPDKKHDIDPRIEESLKKGLALAPTDFRGNFNMGLLYVKKIADYATCKDQFERCVSLRPDNAQSHVALGVMMQNRTPDGKYHDLNGSIQQFR